MGYSVNQYGAPVKAFNSHKNWITGWLQHYSVHLRPLSDNPMTSKTTYVGRVAALADAPHVPVGKEVVLLRLGRTLFLQYNRAKGFHRGTGTPNTVTIVYAQHDEDASTRVASLEVGELYEHTGNPRLIGNRRNDDNDKEEEEPDDNVGLVVALCRMGVDDSSETPIDYAELVIQWRDPKAPRAADLNLALCNIRNDKSAPVFNFGVALDKNHDDRADDYTTAKDPIDIPTERNRGKETVLLILGIIMAGIGMACMAVSAYLVIRQCRTWEQQEQQQHPQMLEIQEENKSAENDGEKKPPKPASPDSFQTAATSSFDSWTESALVTERDMTTTHHSGHDDNDEEDIIMEVTQEVEPPAQPPRQREWWEEIVENLKNLANLQQQHNALPPPRR